MKFYKLCSNGTDYIAVKCCSPEKRAEITAGAGILCGRNCGIGANGVILYEEKESGIRADVIAPDGSERSFDADAAACLDTLYPEGDLTVEFNAGTVNVRRGKSENGQALELHMGKATFLPGDIPLACSDPVIEKPVEAGNRIVILTALRLGRVYAVHETYDLERLNTEYIGEKLTRHSLFRKNADAVFVQKNEDDALKVRCYRKGTGTVAADNGAAAAAVAALCRTGRLKYGVPTDIVFDGGAAAVICRRDHSAVIKTTAKVIFEGNIDL